MPDTRVYWAAEPTSEQCAQRFVEKRRRYLSRLQQSGRAPRMLAAWNQQYGWGVDGARTTSFLTASGERGELVDMATNDFAALVQQAVVMLTGSPPQWKSVVQNADYKARATAELADGLCQAYSVHGGLEAVEAEVVKAAVLVSEGWLVQGWDRNAGRVVAVDDATGEAIHEGDVYHRALPPWDVCYDSDCRDVKSLQWAAFRTARNRYDLAAWRPDLKDKLMAQNPTPNSGEAWIWDLRLRPTYADTAGSDFVDVWEIRHKPTLACPKGRLLVMVSPDCVLFDSAMADPQHAPGMALYSETPEGVQPGQVADFGYPYKDLHMTPLAPEWQVGTSNGHTATFDLLGLAQAIDTCATAMASAANAGGITNWWMQSTGENAGGNVNVDDLPGAFKLIKSPTKPEVIPGGQVDPQALAFAQFCSERMVKRLGLNETALGEAPKGMPAQLAALLQTQVVQFYSAFQGAVFRMGAEARTGLIQILQRFARDERLAYIVGSDRAWTLKPWKAEQLESFEAVTFEPLGNVMRTQAGRMDFADKLMAQGQVDARQYLTLVSTGRLDPIWTSDTANLARIQATKELLQRGIGLPPVQQVAPGVPAVEPDGTPIFQAGGEYVRPLASDTHWVDIPEYLALLSTPEARSNPAVTKAVLEVVRYQLQLWRQMDPILMAIQGCPPNLMQMLAAPAPMAPPMGGSTSGTPPPAPGAQSVASGPDTPPIRLPSPPPDPTSGQKPPPPEMRTA